jgi:uncharacterized protein YbdZ (MbtH family)
MTWDVLQNSEGNLIQQPSNEPIPSGWELIVVTANPDYLTEHFAAIADIAPEEI